MSDQPTGLRALLFSRTAVLLGFVLATAVNSLFLALNQDTADGWLTSAVAICAYAVIAYFTHQRQVIVTWAAIGLMVFYGGGFAHDGVVGFSRSPGLGLLRLAAGCYLIWGALLIHRTRDTQP